MVDRRSPKDPRGWLAEARERRFRLAARAREVHFATQVHGRAIARACELALAWLDASGLFPTMPAERGVKLTWPDALPVDAGFTNKK